MEKLINESGFTIFHKMAQSVAIQKKINEKIKANQNAEFEAFLGDELEVSGVSRTMLEDKNYKEYVARILGKKFVYQPSPEFQAELDTLKQEKCAILPDGISSMVWRPDSCGCEIHEIHNTNDKQKVGEAIVQPFIVNECEAHSGFDMEETYDIIKNEMLIKRDVMVELQNDGALGEDTPDEESGVDPGLLGAGKKRPRRFKKGVEFSYTFTGTGKNRVLNVEIKGAVLTKTQKDILRSKFSSDKVSV